MIHGAVVDGVQVHSRAMATLSVPVPPVGSKVVVLLVIVGAQRSVVGAVALVTAELPQAA